MYEYLESNTPTFKDHDAVHRETLMMIHDGLEAYAKHGQESESLKTGFLGQSDEDYSVTLATKIAKAEGQEAAKTVDIKADYIQFPSAGGIQFKLESLAQSAGLTRTTRSYKNDTSIALYVQPETQHYAFAKSDNGKMFYIDTEEDYGTKRTAINANHQHISNQTLRIHTDDIPKILSIIKQLYKDLSPRVQGGEDKQLEANPSTHR